MTFEADGTTTVGTSGNTASGTWTSEGNTITAVYSVNGGLNFVTIQGELTHNSAVTKLKGFYYNGDEAIEGNEEGFVQVVMN